MSKANTGNIIIKSDEPNKISVGSKAQAEYLVSQVANKLLEHYKHYMWHVQISPDNSVVGIRCLNVHGNYGYVVHTMDIQNDPDMKAVVKAGGEILERANMNRSRMVDGEDFASELDIVGAKFKRSQHNDGKIKVI